VLVVPGLLLAHARRFSARADRRWPPVGLPMRVSDEPVHFIEGGRRAPVVLVQGASANLRD